jgi:hypothetical protein
MSAVAPLAHSPYFSLEEIEHFVLAFENATLPRADWTHRAHLTMATWYLSRHLKPAAIELIRGGILRLNRALGIVTDADHGYHETITLFYVDVIAHHLSQANGAGFLEAMNSLLATRGAVDLPLKYYSRERLFSRVARATWIAPDLQPFEWTVTTPAGA